MQSINQKYFKVIFSSIFCAHIQYECNYHLPQLCPNVNLKIILYNPLNLINLYVIA